MVLVMDHLLGVDSKLVEIDQLSRWSQVATLQHTNLYNINQEFGAKSPFPFNSELNSKVILWNGDLTSLKVDVIVHSTDETLTERNPKSDSLFLKAGPGLRNEIEENGIECRTGEVCVTGGHQLPAKYIIHTVGPLYNIKYQSAAENTLHTCVRNVLLQGLELKAHSIALSVINSVTRNYPPDEGAHITLRTVRRFLEKQVASDSQGFETVVIVVDSCDAGIYEVLMPLYFPRSVGEERAAILQLPSTGVGGPFGEPLFPERQIRIIDNPQHHHECNMDTLFNLVLILKYQTK